jgi:hypothetical protein
LAIFLLVNLLVSPMDQAIGQTLDFNSLLNRVATHSHDLKLAVISALKTCKNSG